jgi:DNA-directed RNA polymerase III subunit RPC7
LLIKFSLDKELFPKELWSTISGEEAEEGRKVIKRKSLLLSGNQLSNLTPEQRRQALADKLKDVVDDDEADNETVRDEDEAEVEQDYDYEDDEAEMGGDYDGEQYFDGGENDEDDGGDGGGGGDDY